MTQVNVILDWLLAHGGSPSKRPPPASEAALRDLTARGAPDDLVSLYQIVGSDLRGLVPDGKIQGPGVLLSPQSLFRHEHWWPFTRPVEGDGWGEDGWAITSSGEVGYYRSDERRFGSPVLHNPLPSLAALFDRHLQSILAGHLVWHPGWEMFVASHTLLDPDLVPTLVGPHFQELTQLLISRLQALEDAPLLGLGTLSVYDGGRRGSFLQYDDGRDSSPEWFHRRGPCPFEELPIAGFEDQKQAAQRLAAEVGKRLRAGEAVEWPGLGVFGHREEDFAPYPALGRALHLS